MQDGGGGFSFYSASCSIVVTTMNFNRAVTTK